MRKTCCYFVLFIFFGIPLLKAAEELNEQEDEKTFGAIQMLASILQEVAQSVEGDDIELDKTFLREPNPPCLYKTEKGIGLVAIDIYPKRLITPQGTIKIKFNRNIENEIEFWKKFCDLVELDFLFDLSKEVEGMGIVCELYDDERLNRLVEESLMKPYRRSFYEIKQVKDMDVPKLQVLEDRIMENFKRNR